MEMMLRYQEYREENCLASYFQGILHRLKTDLAAVNKKIKISLIFDSFTINFVGNKYHAQMTFISLLV
jgi:hypothetical protein